VWRNLACAWAGRVAWLTGAATKVLQQLVVLSVAALEEGGPATVRVAHQHVAGPLSSLACLSGPVPGPGDSQVWTTDEPEVFAEIQ
jgi:hypothetical protein